MMNETGTIGKAALQSVRFYQLKPEFLALNPAGLVPVLVDGGYARMTSRLAYASAMPPAGSEGGQPAPA